MSIMYESESDESENESISDEKDIQDDEGQNDEGQNDEGQSLRKELADIPLGEIQKLKETVGLKKYNEAIFGMSVANKESDEDEDEDEDDKQSRKKLGISKIKMAEKKKKSEPEEMSSKRRIFKPRHVVDDTKKKRRDPRFDSLSGKYNEDLFEKTYSFVEDIKKEELNTVKKQFKKTRNKEKKGELHKLLQRMEEQEKIKTAQQKRKEIEKKRKKEEYLANKSGKKTFYLKKSDAKKLDMADKYRDLQKSGQLDNYMRKKRKHIASKEKKKFHSME